MTWEAECTILLWDIKRDRQVRWSKEIPTIGDIVFSPNDDHLAYSVGKEIHVLDVKTGEERWSGSWEKPVTRMAFSPNGKQMVSSDGFTVSIWEFTVDQMRRLDDFSHPETTPQASNKDQLYTYNPSTVGAIAMSPDGRFIALISNDSTVWVCNAETRRRRRLFARTNGQMTSLRFPPDGQYLISNRGVISLQPDSDESGVPKSDNIEGHRLAFLGKEWLVCDGRKMLWFPPDYRSYCVVYHDGTFALGSTSGRVNFIRVEFP